MLKCNMVTILFLFNVSLFSMNKETLLKRKEKEHLYSLYHNAAKEFDKEGSIENIKQYHNAKKISYNTPYYPDFIKRIDGFKQEYGQFPIDWSLRSNEVKFALFLLKDIKVNVNNTSDYDNNTIHFFARGIRGNKIDANHVEILKILIEKKANINAINKNNKTPLAEYIDSSKNNIDNQILRLFFDNNAQITCNEEKQCNLNIFYYDEKQTIFTQHCNILSFFMERKSTLDLDIDNIKLIFRERFFKIKKNYFHCLLFFKNFNKNNKSIPKVIQNEISIKVIQHELYDAINDIYNAINDIRNHINNNRLYIQMKTKSISKIISPEFKKTCNDKLQYLSEETISSLPSILSCILKLSSTLILAETLYPYNFENFIATLN